MAADGIFYALNSKDGTIKWSFGTKTKKPISRSAPLIGTNEIYIGCDDGFYALDFDGRIKWQIKVGCEMYSPTISRDGTIFVGSREGFLYAIKTSSTGLGKTPWPKFHRNQSNTQ